MGFREAAPRSARGRLLRLSRHVVPLGVTVLVAATAAQAQPSSGSRSHWLGGGGVITSIPLGEFDDATDVGVGVSGNLAFTPGGGSLGLRLQVGGVLYGSRNVGAPMPGTGGLITQDLSVDNWLLNAGIGPQLVARSGAVRPYAYALAGLGYFATESVLQSGDTYYYDDVYRSTTNFDDTTFAWSAGAGLLIPVSGDMALDIGVQYVANGTVRYLAEGDLLPSPTGAPPRIVPRETEANLIQVTVGLTFGR